MDAQRALLDALMGSSRNLTDEEKKEHREVGWDDPDVCGPFMARFCPHDLFINTKSNLGTCPKIHDPLLKQSFEDSPRHAAVLPKFEAELANRCEKLVLDLDRKIRRGRDRLAQEVELPLPTHGDKSEQLSVLEEKIKKLLEQIEQLGETGKIDEATALMRMIAGRRSESRQGGSGQPAREQGSHDSASEEDGALRAVRFLLGHQRRPREDAVPCHWQAAHWLRSGQGFSCLVQGCERRGEACEGEGGGGASEPEGERVP